MILLVRYNMVYNVFGLINFSPYTINFLGSLCIVKAGKYDNKEI